MIHMARQCVGLWLLASSLAVVTTGVSSLEDPSELYQRAEYYARKYEETLKELETSQNSHIHKRSTNTQNQCSDLARAIQLMCPSYKLDMGVTTTPTSISEDFELSDMDISTMPDVMLSKVIAKRIGNNVEVEFFIKHSSASSIQRFGSFDNEKKFLSPPTNGGKFKYSRVSFVFDASLCGYDDQNKEERVYIWPVGKETSYIEAEVNICRFDMVHVWHSGNKTESWERKKTDGQPISQVLETPKLKILGHHEDTVLIERGKHISIEAEIILDSRTDLRVLVELWDWESQRLLTDSNDIEIKGRELDIDLDKSGRNNNLLSIDVLDEVVLNTGEDSDDDDDDDGKVKAKIRITVNVGSGELSGTLTFIYKQNHLVWGKKTPVIKEMSNYLPIALKLPYKISRFPLNSNRIQLTTDNVQCDKDGNRNGYKYGKNCTIQCYAWGSNIKSIFIVKSHPYRPPVKSSSSVLGHTFAYIIQDLGPASQDNDGIYKCTVVFQNGETKTKNIHLATSRFTKVTNFTLEHVSDSTSRLVCTSFGPPNLDMRILGDSRSSFTRERLDDKTGSLRSVESFENGTTVLTLVIPNEELEYPIFCYASGHGSFDRMSFRPSAWSRRTHL